LPGATDSLVLMARSSIPGLVISLVVLLAGLLLAFTVGRYPVGIGDLFSVIAAKLTGHPSNAPAAIETVIWQVRGPRVLAACLVGAAFAVAGTAFQGLFRNPLVSPDILGPSRSPFAGSSSAPSVSKRIALERSVQMLLRNSWHR
jgi:iron complex transport system permease protein